MKIQHKQSGLSLLEVLIAWVIISISILSLLAYQRDSLRQTNQSYFKTVFWFQMEAMLERLRVNQSDSTRLREFEIWQKQNQELLPGTQSNFNCGVSCSVKIENPQIQILNLTAIA